MSAQLETFWREHSIRKIHHELESRHYDDAIAVVELVLWLEPKDVELKDCILNLFTKQLDAATGLNDSTVAEIRAFCSTIAGRESASSDYLHTSASPSLNRPGPSEDPAVIDRVGPVARGFARDINNLLTVIFGYTELLKERSRSDSELLGYLDKIEKAALMAAHVTRRVITGDILEMRSDAEVEQPAALAVAKVQSGRGRLLLVEDDQQVGAMIRESLERRGYKVLHASSAEEALSIEAQFKDNIDLLITDVATPGLRDLATRMKSRRPEIKTLYLSGLADIASFDLEQSGVPFLRKPFTLGDFVQSISEILGKN